MFFVYPNTYHSNYQKCGPWPSGDPQDPFRVSAKSILFVKILLFALLLLELALMV